MGWQTLAIYGTVALTIIVIAYISRRMLRREARRGAEDSEARKNLEQVLEVDRKSHARDGEPIPLARPAQLGRLRSLLARLPRRRNREAPSDE